MAYDYTIPAAGNIVRTTSGDLAKMQYNFEHLLGLASGLYNDGTAPDTALRGFYFGRSGYRNRFKFESDASNVFRMARNVGTAGSPSWQTVFAFSQNTGAALEASYPILGQTPTASGHLATKGYVDGLGSTLSGLTDTNLTSVADGASLVFDQATQKWIDSFLTYVLNDLTDVSAGSPTSGYSLVYNGSQWVPSGISGGGSATLSGLTDTNLTSVADGAVMTFDQATQKWIDSAAPAGTLSGLTDTNLTSVADQAIMVFDQATQKWIDAAQPAGTLSGLTDTNLTSVADQAIMVFDQATQKWIDATHSHALNDLSDASVSSPTSGQHLVYNGSAWANADVGSGVRVVACLSGAQTQSIPETAVTIASGNEVPVNIGGWTVLSGTITVPDGVSRVDIVGQANWASASVGQNYDAEIYVGSSPVSGVAGYLLSAKDRRRKSTDSDTSNQQVVALDVPVVSGDTITLRVYQTGSAGGLNVTGGTGLMVREATNGGSGGGGGGGGSSTLSGLTDTNLTAVADGATLTFDSASQKWIDSAAPAGTLSGLTDTNLTSVADNSIMTFDQATQKWIDAAYPTNTDTLSGLTDTNLTSVVDGGSIKFDQATQKWIDSTPVASGVGLVESFDIAVESVASGESFTISLYAFYPYDVETVRGKTSNGTCDLAFKIDSAYVTGLSGITVSGTETGWNSSGSKAVALGNTFSVEVEDASACSGLLLSIKTTRT